MKFFELKRHLQSDSIKPAYIIAGEDAFLRGAAAGHFKSIAVTAMPELNVSLLSDCTDGTAVYNACETMPVLGGRRLVLCFDYKGGDTELTEYLKKPNPAAVLVFVCEKLTENLSRIVPKAELIDCGKLADEHIASWVQGKLAETGSHIENPAFLLLLDYCGRSMTRISRETEKLGIAKANDAVTVLDVENLVTPETEYKIYELADAVGAKNGKKAAAVLRNMFESGMAPSLLLGTVYSHFRRLLYCAVSPLDPDLSKKLGVKEYAVKLAIAQAKQFGAVRLKQICDEFHKIDFSVKQGEMTDKTGLESYVFGILTG